MTTLVKDSIEACKLYVYKTIYKIFIQYALSGNNNKIHYLYKCISVAKVRSWTSAISCESRRNSPKNAHHLHQRLFWLGSHSNKLYKWQHQQHQQHHAQVANNLHSTAKLGSFRRRTELNTQTITSTSVVNVEQEYIVIATRGVCWTNRGHRT